MIADRSMLNVQYHYHYQSGRRIIVSENDYGTNLRKSMGSTGRVNACIGGYVHSKRLMGPDINDFAREPTTYCCYRILYLCWLSCLRS